MKFRIKSCLIYLISLSVDFFNLFCKSLFISAGRSGKLNNTACAILIDALMQLSIADKIIVL